MKGLDAAAARKLIDKDLKHFSAKLARGDQVDMIRTGGIPRSRSEA